MWPCFNRAMCVHRLWLFKSLANLNIRLSNRHARDRNRISSDSDSGSILKYNRSIISIRHYSLARRHLDKQKVGNYLPGVIPSYKVSRGKRFVSLDCCVATRFFVGGPITSTVEGTRVRVRLEMSKKRERERRWRRKKKKRRCERVHLCFQLDLLCVRFVCNVNNRCSSTAETFLPSYVYIFWRLERETVRIYIYVILAITSVLVYRRDSDFCFENNLGPIIEDYVTRVTRRWWTRAHYHCLPILTIRIDKHNNTRKIASSKQDIFPYFSTIIYTPSELSHVSCSLANLYSIGTASYHSEGSRGWNNTEMSPGGVILTFPPRLFPFLARTNA